MPKTEIQIIVNLFGFIFNYRNEFRLLEPYRGNYNLMENTYVGFVSIGVGVAIGIGIDALEEYSIPIPIPTPIPINPNNSNFHESGTLTL